MSAVRIALLVAVMGMTIAFDAHAVSSASFVFDFVSDAADNSDGPQYNITGIGPVNDGNGCDDVIMVMVDPTGTVVDIDPVCLNLGTGLASDDGDYGSVFAAQFSPITYALFDVNAADVAVLNGLSQSDPAYLNYLVTHGTLLAEQTLAQAGLPVQTAFSFMPKTPLSVPALGTGGLAILLVGMLAAAAWQRRRAVRT